MTAAVLEPPTRAPQDRLAGPGWYTEARIPHRLRRLFGPYVHWPRELQQDLGQEIAIACWQQGLTLWSDALPDLVARTARRMERAEREAGACVDAPEQPDLEDRVFSAQRRQSIAAALATLWKFQQRVIILRFGLDRQGERGRTLEGVGREFGVSRERIRQIEAKALRSLRHPTRANPLREGADLELVPGDENLTWFRVPADEIAHSTQDDRWRRVWRSLPVDPVCHVCRWPVQPSDDVAFFLPVVPRHGALRTVHSACLAQRWSRWIDGALRLFERRSAQHLTAGPSV